MSIEDDIACLEEVPTFRLLGPNALRILAIGCESSALDEGEVLFAAGDPADCGYVIQDGSFQLEIIDTTRPVTATAAEPSTVCAFPAICFARRWRDFPRPRNAFATTWRTEPRKRPRRFRACGRRSAPNGSRRRSEGPTVTAYPPTAQGGP